MSRNPPQTHAPLEPPSDGRAPGPPSCRFCDAPLELTVVDLGMSPLCESYRSAAQLREMEAFYPLHVLACERCYLVQLEAFVPDDEIFEEYAYFSAFSSSWVEHARVYVESITGRLGLGPDDLVVELASNDGYLLQHFVGTGIPILGIDPAANIAVAAEERGVPTLVAFFGRHVAEQLVAEGKQAALVVGNNVLAQVSDLNDFVAGVKILLRADGTATFEFPHLQRLLDGLQYDTIYHEHFSYFSLATVAEVFASHGLEVYDVEELSTHGGSLRVYAQHAGGRSRTDAAVGALIAREEGDGLRTPERYARFSEEVKESKRALLEMLIELRREGRRSSATALPARGTRSSTTAASAPTCSTTRSTATPTSRDCSPRGRTSPSTRRRGSPRPGPTTSSCCPGTSSTRSRSSSPTSAIGAVG